MRVFFKKSDTTQFVIFPEPTNLDDFHAVEIADETELEQKSLQQNTQGDWVLVDAAPNAFSVWNGEGWEINQAAQAQMLAERKTALLQTIATKADHLKSLVFAGYSTAEVESFYRQEKEALALKDDPTYPALMLTRIANSRGVPLEILAQKVLEKAELSAPIIGDILGKKQRFEGLIQAVENWENFADLEKEIELWQL